MSVPMLRLSKVIPRVGSRGMSVISSKPRVRISMTEKITHGVVMSVACSLVPIWITYKIKDYKAAAEAN